MTIPFIAPDVSNAIKELQKDLAYFFPELTHFYGYASTPDHNSRRCLDAMVYDSSNKYVGQQGRKNLPYSQRIALGDRVCAFLRKNADHYHLNGVIWNRKVWGFPHDGGAGGRHYAGPYGAARKYTVTAHDDHNHIEVDGRPFTPLRPLLPTYYVDPLKVSTTLTGNALNGGTDVQLKPGTAITDGLRIEGDWLITANGRSFHTGYLTKTKPASTPVAPMEPSLTRFRVATYNILSDAAGKSGGEGPLANRLPAIIKSLRDSDASVYLLQECNKTASALVQDKLGPDWMWTREGTRTVMWNKTVWNWEKEDKISLPNPHVDVDKTFPLPLLTHIKGGDQVWFGSTHFVSSAGNDATSTQIDAQRKASAEKIVEVCKTRTRVVIGGDLNTYSMSKGKAKPVLIAGGLKLLTRDKTFASTKVDSFDNKTAGGQQIDEIIVKGCTFVNGKIIKGTGSDHHLMVAELTINK